jgi:glycogen synthase
VDIVEGSIWDSEGLATVLDDEFCTLTNLETPLKAFLRTSPEFAAATPDDQAHHDALIRREILVTTRAAAVRAVSQAVVHSMESLYGLTLDPERLFVTPNGIRDRSGGNVARLDKPSRRLDLFLVGRFEGRKGIDVLLQVVPRITSRFPQVRFTLAGGEPPRAGSIEAKFRDQYPGLVLGEKVVFAGKIGDRQLDAHLSACDIFVAPSRYESFGLVYLEAMMFSKPVIGCRAGGIPEVIQHGVNGLLAEPGDAESLYDALAQLIENPAMRARFGASGRSLFLADFTGRKYVERTLASYRQALRLWKGRTVSCGA